ncbi:MAG: hypothetical protein K6G28_00775 [Acholeplasmatales bacterium]|nr:hypothetical protein [Acholeplasmatales bacterium]
MNYLFFDIECSVVKQGDSSICSFGYCLCDEQLNIIEKEDFLMKPYLGYSNSILETVISYSKETLERQHEFPFYYQKIKNLLENPNNIVIGQSTHYDATYLSRECNHYNLDNFECVYYDVADIFLNLFNNDNYKSLKDEGLALNAKSIQSELHSSLEDALLTRCVFKELSLKFNIGYKQMLLNSKTIGLMGEENHFFDDFRILSNNMSKGSTNKKLFIGYNKRIKANVKPDAKLRGKIVVMSQNYEKTHFREMIYISYRIKEEGGRYSIDSKFGNYFVSSPLIDQDGNKIFDPRMLNRKKNSKLIDIKEFLHIINFNDEECMKFYQYVLDNNILLTKDERNLKKRLFLKERARILKN